MQLNAWDLFWIIFAVGIAIGFANTSGVFTTEYMTGYESNLYDQDSIQSIIDEDGDVTIIDTLTLYVSMFLTALGLFYEMLLAVIIYYPDLTTKFGVPEAVAPIITGGAWIVIIISIIKFISNRFVGSGE